MNLDCAWVQTVWTGNRAGVNPTGPALPYHIHIWISGEERHILLSDGNGQLSLPIRPVALNVANWVENGISSQINSTSEKRWMGGGKYFGCRFFYDLAYEASKESHKFDRMFLKIGIDPKIGKRLFQR